MSLITIATCLFVIGQFCLRENSKIQKISAYETLLLFSIVMGVIAFVLFLVKEKSLGKLLLRYKTNKLIILAGLCFLIGNGFWISAIQQKVNLGILRTFMTGIESSLLLILSYLFYKEMITYQQFFGVFFILFGLYNISQ